MLFLHGEEGDFKLLQANAVTLDWGERGTVTPYKHYSV